MKLTMTNKGPAEAKSAAGFAGVCRACGQRILAQIKRAKEAIRAESAATLAAHRHVVQLALNEAEALAWQTRYPHLVFPTLALEKVQAIVNWNDRQRRVRWAGASFAKETRKVVNALASQTTRTENEI